MMTLGKNQDRCRYGRVLPVALLFGLLFVWGVLPTPAAALEPSDCAQCHGDNVAAGHHQSELYSQGLCSQCHEGVTTGGDCASCHTFNPQQNAHHATAEATSGNCAECHTNVGDLADCLSCHQGMIRTPHHLAKADDPRTPNVVDPIDCASCHTSMEPLTGCNSVSCHPGDIRTAHHTTAKVDVSDCSNCHTGVAPVNDCENCHTGAYWVEKSGAPDARAAHHAAPGATQNCQSCHTNAPRPFNCHECHNGQLAPWKANRHHEVANNASMTCGLCHDAIAVDFNINENLKDRFGNPIPNRPDCQDCHAPSEENRTRHHDMATTSPDLDCSTCHSDAGDVPGCATCHDAAYWTASGRAGTARAQHHDVVQPALGIDCNACHTDLTFDNRCESCHATGEVRLQAHHSDRVPSSVSCGFCHGASADIPQGNGTTTPLETSCLFCHDAGFWTEAGRAGTAFAQHHEVVRVEQNIDCSACHATLVPKDTCDSCHTPEFWSADGRFGSARAQHHQVAAVGRDCAECHGLTEPPMQVVTGCETCHAPATGGANPAAPWAADLRSDHHLFASTVNGDGNPANDISCAECHASLAQLGGDCIDCHQGESASSHHVDVRNAYPEYTSCASCHGAGVVEPNGDCLLCHDAGSWAADGDAKTRHHKVADTQSISCNTCHAAIEPAGGCRSCHGDWWPQGAFNLHHETAVATSYSFNCFSCHTMQRVGTTSIMLMPTEAKCETCHTQTLPAKLGTASTTVPAIHHATDGYVNNQCGTCHTGIADIGTLPLDCAECHAGKARDGSPAMHHVTTKVDNTVCSNCHQGVDQSQLDCAACHADKPRDGSAAMHHVTTKVDNTVCSNCHVGVTAGNDCASCHDGRARDGSPTMHHASSDFINDNCNACHIGAEGARADCSACHEATGQPSIVSVHHATPGYTPGNCGTCHEGIDGLNGDALDCAVCHAGTARDGSQAMHHGNTDGAPPYGAVDCLTCHAVRTFAQMTAADECAACHEDGTGLIEWRHHENSVAGQAGNCGACHTVNQAQLDCATCHDGKARDGGALMHHGTPTAASGTCTDCHAAVDAGNLSCQSCHEPLPVKNGSMAMHHGTTSGDPDYTQSAQSCTLCHVGAESALIDCAACHVSADPTVPTMVERHHDSALNCTSCHTAVNTAELVCGTCHAGQPADLNGSLNMHHDLTLAGSTGQCATCHAGTEIAESDCSSCHTGSDDQQALADKHHLTETAQLGLCITCHAGAEVTGSVCATCHGNDSNHHIQPEYAAGSCTSCHTTIGLNGANCEACHTAPGKPSIQETHHGVPLEERNGDCSACHTAVSSPDVCGNCHSASPHHTTPWSIAGDCAHCHTVPAMVQDRPAQAACRECHGSTKHNKGGPVQNFGACAACHNTMPFHPKPSRAPGYMVMVGGKGKFNLFWSAMTNGGRNEVREDVRPNGEDMKDKGGHDRYEEPTISFNMYPIEYAGKAYQVPGFSPPANYGSTTSLSVCTSCHVDRSDKVSCSNSKWTAHLSLGRVNEATYRLAEATYIGSLCGGTAPPPANANLALNKSASASGDEGSSYQASNAVDGNASSRWYVRSYGEEWLRVDLGQVQRVGKVVIRWHSYYARQYDVLVSKDGSSWTRVREERYGDGGTDTITFTERDARYVRVLCKQRDREGYSIYELEVYNQ